MAWPPATHQDVEDAVGGLRIAPGGLGVAPSAYGGPILLSAPQITNNNYVREQTMTNGVIYCSPFFLSGPATLAKISLKMGGPASPGALIRFGACKNLPGDFAPGAFVLDTGAVPCTAGYSAFTAALATPLGMTAGVYWFCAKQEGSPATSITFSGPDAVAVKIPIAANPADGWDGTYNRQGYASYRSSAQSDGAFPATFPMTGVTKVGLGSDVHKLPQFGLEFSA